MNYIIGDVEERHLAEIEELEKVCFSCPWTEAQLRSQLKDSMHEFICAEDEQGRALGYVGMMFVLDEGYISNVAVAPYARHQGIANALIEKITELAELHKLAFITLEVRAGNDPAIRLYEKHGFAPVGRRKAYYVSPKDDAVLMTKYLNRGADLENTCI